MQRARIKMLAKMSDDEVMRYEDLASGGAANREQTSETRMRRRNRGTQSQRQHSKAQHSNNTATESETRRDTNSKQERRNARLFVDDCEFGGVLLCDLCEREGARVRRARPEPRAQGIIVRPQYFYFHCCQNRYRLTSSSRAKLTSV